MTKWRPLFEICVLASAFTSLTNLPIAQSASIKKPTLAVMRFISAGGLDKETAKDLPLALTSVFEDSMQQGGRYQLVERVQIGKVLEELKFQQSGLCGVECAVSVGEQLAAQYVVIGELARIGTLYYLRAKLVDVEKATIAKSQSVTCERPEELVAKARELAQLVQGGSLPSVPTPASTYEWKLPQPQSQQASASAVQQPFPPIFRAEFLGRCEQEVKALALSPDMKNMAVGCYDKSVQVWALDGPGRVVLGRLDGDVRSLAYSPSGTLLAAGAGDATVRIWDFSVSKAEILGRCRIQHPRKEICTCMVNAVAFDPTGTLLAAGGTDKVLRVYDVPRGTVRDLGVCSGDILCLTFIGNGDVLAAGCADGKVIISSLSQGGLTTVGRCSRQVLCIAQTDGGRRLITGSGDGSIRSWDLDTKLSRVVFQMDGWANGINTDETLGLFYVSSQSGRVTVIRKSDENVGDAFRQEGGISAMCLSRDGRTIIVGGRGGSAISWKR